jgi:hypothetical protein
MEGVWTKKTVRGFILGWFCSDGFGFRDFSGFAKLEDQGTVFWPFDFKRNAVNL